MQDARPITLHEVVYVVALKWDLSNIIIWLEGLM